MYRFWSVLLPVIATISLAQNKNVSGAAASVLLNADNTATIEVLNSSTKDITGFVLEIDSVDRKGEKDQSERTEDYGRIRYQAGTRASSRRSKSNFALSRDKRWTRQR